MPITIQHGPASLLGSLAVAAGEAQGQQLQAARDIQLTSLALAAENRTAAAGRASQNRTFALQRAGAAQMAQRQTEPDALELRARLLKSVAEAKAANIYSPAQISQMEILANLGDGKGVRSLLGKLPQASARRREIREQLNALDDIQKSTVGPAQKELETVNKRLGERFLPETQQYLRANPRFADEETVELLAQQQQLTDQLAKIIGQTEQTKKMLRLGVTIPEQMAFKVQQDAQLGRQESRKLKQEAARVKASGELSDVEKVKIDRIRDQKKEQRRIIAKQITELRKELAPFKDEVDKPEKLAARIKPLREVIQQLEFQLNITYAEERNQVGSILEGASRTVTGAGPTTRLELNTIYTNGSGQRARFIGYDEQGRPMMALVE